MGGPAQPGEFEHAAPPPRGPGPRRATAVTVLPLRESEHSGMSRMSLAPSQPQGGQKTPSPRAAPTTGASGQSTGGLTVVVAVTRVPA